MDWYFTVTSDKYGSEDYGPYDSLEDAKAGITRVKAKAAQYGDGVDREYSEPESGPRSE